MAGSDERDAKIKAIESKDKITIPPELRAKEIYYALRGTFPNWTEWDLICFAVNYLGWQSQNLRWLEFPAKHIAQLVYTAHYMDDDDGTDTTSGIKNISGDSINKESGNGDSSRVDVSGFELT